MALESKFHRAMEEIVRRSVKECKYTPSAFIKMLHEDGGVRAAQRLLAKPEPSEGFTKLYLCGRLDLTVEATVLQGQFAPLFTLEERQRAWDWLAQYEWDGRGDRPSVATPISDASVALEASTTGTATAGAMAVIGRLTHYSFPVPPVDPVDEFNEGRRWRVIPEGEPVRRLPGIGVYIFLNGDEALYIGCAVADSLVGRALDYLWKEGVRVKTYERVRREADRLILIFTQHKVAARMLESDLIARLQPTLNDDLKWGEGRAALDEYRELMDQLNR